jgi:hypothetical protein
VRTSAPAASDEARPYLRGEALTRHAVTVITAAIVVMTFAFSLGNVTGVDDSPRLVALRTAVFLALDAVDCPVRGRHLNAPLAGVAHSDDEQRPD